MNKDISKKTSTNEKPSDSQIFLDDDRRIKILSPGMMVFKRFIRNKLAITGAIFILVMFLFSYAGGWLMPYGEAQIFTKYVEMPKIFAAISENTEYKIVTANQTDFSMIARSQFVLAANAGETVFTAQGVNYSLKKVNDEVYIISSTNEVAKTIKIGNVLNVEVEDSSLGDDFKEAYMNALLKEEDTFNFNNESYLIKYSKKNTSASRLSPLAVTTMHVYDYDSAEGSTTYDFCLQSEIAIEQLREGTAEFVKYIADGYEYEMSYANDKAMVYKLYGNNKVLYSNISKYMVQPLYSDVFLSLDFKNTVKELIAQDDKEFTYKDTEGKEQNYSIERNNDEWTIKWIEDTYVIKAYDYPSTEHIMGTDGNGMDLLTRLMYGGRVSLMIGFIVVIIEIIVGTVIGGIAGYFGKRVDNLLMRIVDVFNCIPQIPIILILGAMMDQQRIEPELRMVFLMILLAIFGWPYIARMVRGQILSLREQEFMIATEATGLSVSRRIFKHLIPNVIPQLIVIATLSLGQVILLESVLSFLGIGVKFPFASWGNIINAVSNVHVMTNYLFVWIPAGFCILITVLGFNFIGDGLRDAFDPKMKR